MLPLKDQVGKVAGPYRQDVPQKRVSLFCQAIGAKDSSTAPPTFLTVFRQGEFDLFAKLGIELAKVLHAEQEYHYENPILAGDTVSFQTTLSHVLEKQSTSTSMQFLTFSTSVQSERSAKVIPIGTSKTTIVIRSKKENAKGGQS